MLYEPISVEKLRAEIAAACGRMDTRRLRFWEAIRIEPEKWQHSSEGYGGGGFWAVGQIGQTVTWYNDIEEGFEYSVYQSRGTVTDHGCSQFELEWVIEELIARVCNGQESSP